MRCVGHQHAIAAGEAQIGGQRRALVAALFLDDLDQQHLAALDDVLDLVAAAQLLALLAKLVGGAFVDRRAGRAGADFVPLSLALGLGIAGVLAGILGDVVVIVVVVVIFGGAQPLFLGGMLGLFGAAARRGRTWGSGNSRGGFR